jgi:predicted nucleic-acid-binding Zn-ribbon protein
MTVSKCPNCGGSDLYRSAQSTPASGMFGPNLLPALSPGRFRVVVCKDCGLTNFFASNVDRQSLHGPEWERLYGGVSSRPLGLEGP